MATPNPEHLFEQAEKLIVPPPSGPPRQVDVRRAISSAYYAVFHALLTAAADEFVGKTKHASPEYALLYRSINHGWLRSLCDGLKGAQPTKRFASYAPAGGFGPNIQALSLAVIDLQEKRHAADYDPSIRVKTADALLTIRTGRSALARFNRASSARRKRFLALLAFPPR
jgi:ATP phosphoribosyltransferase regulatory subunit HisZ